MSLMINTWDPVTINHFNLVLYEIVGVKVKCTNVYDPYLLLLLSNLFLRIRCPSNCKTQPSYWSPVVGNNIYTDVSKTLNFFLQIDHEAGQSSKHSRSVRKFRKTENDSVYGSVSWWSHGGFTGFVMRGSYGKWLNHSMNMAHGERE